MVEVLSVVVAAAAAAAVVVAAVMVVVVAGCILAADGSFGFRQCIAAGVH